MSEIQFLIGLLKSEEMSKELRDKILDRIAEVESTKTTLAPMPTFPMPQWPGLDQVIRYGQPLHYQDLCDHLYPAIWHGIVPPPCQKCGKQMPNPFTVTSSNSLALE